MKKIGIEKSVICACGLEAQTTAHALSTKAKEKAPGQQKVP